jgi:hypothetical protein
MVVLLEKELQEMLQINIISVGFVPILNLKIFEKEILISLHQFGIAVGKGLDELSN